VGMLITIAYSNAPYSKVFLPPGPHSRQHHAMPYTVPLLSDSPSHAAYLRMGKQARWVMALQRARGVLCGILVEVARYAGGSPRSRLHQRAVLYELEERLLRDVGVERVPGCAEHPHHRFEGYR
jgi:hypothetical protein